MLISPLIPKTVLCTVCRIQCVLVFYSLYCVFFAVCIVNVFMPVTTCRWCVSVTFPPTKCHIVPNYTFQTLTKSFIYLRNNMKPFVYFFIWFILSKKIGPLSRYSKCPSFQTNTILGENDFKQKKPGNF